MAIFNTDHCLSFYFTFENNKQINYWLENNEGLKYKEKLKILKNSRKNKENWLTKKKNI